MTPLEQTGVAAVVCGALALAASKATKTGFLRWWTLFAVVYLVGLAAWSTR